jgi:hypothetical protein
MKEDHPESLKAFIAFLFYHIWQEIIKFFAKISVKGHILIDIPDKPALPPKKVTRRVVRATSEPPSS